MKIFKIVLGILLFCISAFVSFVCWRLSYFPLPRAVADGLFSLQTMYRVYFLLGWVSGCLAFACLNFIIIWATDLVKFISCHSKNVSIETSKESPDAK